MNQKEKITGIANSTKKKKKSRTTTKIFLNTIKYYPVDFMKLFVAFSLQ